MPLLSVLACCFGLALCGFVLWLSLGTVPMLVLLGILAAGTAINVLRARVSRR